MFLNKIFAKTQANSSNSSNEVNKTLGYYARKISAILGFGVAVNSVNVLANENIGMNIENKREVVGVVKKDVQNIVQPPVLEEKQEVNKLKFMKVFPGETVFSFMKRAFNTTENFQYLIQKSNGNRIKNPNTDLIAFEEYVLARNEKEAVNLSKILSEKSIKNPQKPKNIYSDINNSKEIKAKGGFDFESYIKAISGTESGGKYDADNSKAGKELKVKSSKWAFGKYQFTTETLAGFGIETQEQIDAFKKDFKLQEQIMRKFTSGNLTFALKNKYVVSLHNGGVKINEILSAMHHMGSGGVERVAKKIIGEENIREAFFKKIGNSQDWLNTKTDNYVKSVSKKYEKLAGVEEHKITENPIQIAQIELKVGDEIILGKEIKKSEKVFSSVSSNDEVFETKQTVSYEESTSNVVYLDKPQTEIQKVSLNQEKSEEKFYSIPVQQELDKVPQLVKELFKKELISRIANDNSYSKDFRDKLVSKLSKIDDLEAYYQEQIDYYQNVLQTSKNDIERQKAKKILPGLHKLMKNTYSIIQASNELDNSKTKVA